MLRATRSADVHRCRQDSNNDKDTRVFAGSRRTTSRDQKTCVLVKNCQPRVTFDAPKPEKQRSTKTKKNTVNVNFSSRDIRQVPNRRRVEVQCQNRDLLIRDVCACLAHMPYGPPVASLPPTALLIILQESYISSQSLPSMPLYNSWQQAYQSASTRGGPHLSGLMWSTSMYAFEVCTSSIRQLRTFPDCNIRPSFRNFWLP